jgi:hypothetical protein
MHPIYPPHGKNNEIIRHLQSKEPTFVIDILKCSYKEVLNIYKIVSVKIYLIIL